MHHAGAGRKVKPVVCFLKAGNTTRLNYKITAFILTYIVVFYI